ncbi:MAG: fibrobacter succinogenes major paralogous domain-containing protein [Bacteroidales bacterium]
MKKKQNFRIIPFIFLGFLILQISCSKEKKTSFSNKNFTINHGIVKDYDGNLYDTIHIGSQVWLKQNLKTTHYLNGDPIAKVTDGSQWSNLSTGAYCSYNNDDSYVNTYGLLYNYFAVSDSRKIAPIGWHVSTYSEWSTLYSFLSGNANPLKEEGTTHWNTSTGATNSTGFTALPGGYRFYDGTFNSIMMYGYWWSSNSYFWIMSYNSSSLNNYSDVSTLGFSVRCVKD